MLILYLINVVKTDVFNQLKSKIFNISVCNAVQHTACFNKIPQTFHAKLYISGML